MIEKTNTQQAGNPYLQSTVPPHDKGHFSGFAVTRLPTETIQHIFSFCSISDLSNLRRTCRDFTISIDRSFWISYLKRRVRTESARLLQYFNKKEIENEFNNVFMAQQNNPENPQHLSGTEPPSSVSSEALLGFLLTAKKTIGVNYFANTGSITVEDFKSWDQYQLTDFLVLMQRVMDDTPLFEVGHKLACYGIYKADTSTWRPENLNIALNILLKRSQTTKHSYFQFHTKSAMYKVCSGIQQAKNENWEAQQLFNMMASLINVSHRLSDIYIDRKPLPLIPGNKIKYIQWEKLQNSFTSSSTSFRFYWKPTAPITLLDVMTTVFNALKKTDASILNPPQVQKTMDIFDRIEPERITSFYPHYTKVNILEKIYLWLWIVDSLIQQIQASTTHTENQVKTSLLSMPKININATEAKLPLVQPETFILYWNPELLIHTLERLCDAVKSCPKNNWILGALHGTFLAINKVLPGLGKQHVHNIFKLLITILTDLKPKSKLNRNFSEKHLFNNFCWKVGSAIRLADSSTLNPKQLLKILDIALDIAPELSPYSLDDDDFTFKYLFNSIIATIKKAESETWNLQLLTGTLERLLNFVLNDNPDEVAMDQDYSNMNADLPELNIQQLLRTYDLFIKFDGNKLDSFKNKSSLIRSTIVNLCKPLCDATGNSVLLTLPPHQLLEILDRLLRVTATNTDIQYQKKRMVHFGSGKYSFYNSMATKALMRICYTIAKQDKTNWGPELFFSSLKRLFNALQSDPGYQWTQRAFNGICEGMKIDAVLGWEERLLDDINVFFHTINSCEKIAYFLKNNTDFHRAHRLIQSSLRTVRHRTDHPDTL